MLCFHPAFPESMIRHIGIIVIEMSYCESLVGSALAAATGVEKDATGPIYAQDTRLKIAALRKAAPELAATLDVFEAVLADRNLVVHGMAVDVDERGHARIGFRGANNGKPIQIDDAWMKALRDRIAACAQVFIDFLRPHDMTLKPDEVERGPDGKLRPARRKRVADVNRHRPISSST